MSARFTYSLSGKVLPERAVGRSTSHRQVTGVREGAFAERLGGSSFRSPLTDCGNCYDARPVDDVEDMRERVEAVVRHCVDALGFLLACGYDVELAQVTAPEILGHFVFGVNVQGVRDKDEYTDPNPCSLSSNYGAWSR